MGKILTSVYNYYRLPFVQQTHPESGCELRLTRFAWFSGSRSGFITIPPRVWVCREIRLAVNWLNWLTNPVSSVFLPKCEVDQPILTGKCLSFTIRYTPKQENSVIRLCLFCWWVECSKNTQKIKIYPNYIIHSGYCKMYPRSSLSLSFPSLTHRNKERDSIRI